MNMNKTINIPDTKLTSMDCWVRKMMAHHSTPGLSLAFSDRQRTIYQKTFGYKIIESQELLNPDTLFAIGSIGKTFTAVATLQAYEKKLLDLHAPVTDYLPWFKVQTNYQPITTHHLLTHTAGLIEGTDFTPDGRSEVWALRDSQTGWQPGERFHYSNVGYKVVGLVLQAATGRDYIDLIQEGILEPLEMNGTVAFISHNQRTRFARGYQFQYDDRPAQPGMTLVPAPWLETDTADGSLASTSGDMAKFARMLLNRGKSPAGVVLSEASWELMTSRMVEEESEVYYGYGLNIFEEDGYTHIGHAGDIPGYEAYMWLDADNGFAALVLQTHPYVPRISTLLLAYLRAIVLDTPLPELPDPENYLKPDNFDPHHYAGIYNKVKPVTSQTQKRITLTLDMPGIGMSNGSETEKLNITINDDQLQIDYHGELIPLEQRGDDAFFAYHPDFDRFLLKFGIQESAENDLPADEVFHGGDWFTRQKKTSHMEKAVPEDWYTYCGHYRSHNPWLSNFRIVVRKDELVLIWPSGGEERLTPIREGFFRCGEEDSPERLCLDMVVDGQALRANRSGCDYYRFFTP